MAGPAGGRAGLDRRRPALTMALRPSERLSAAFLGLLLGLALLLRPEGWGLEAVSAGALLGGVVLLPRLRGPAGAGARDLAPVGVVLAVYLLLQPLVAAGGVRWDAALAALDVRWFGSFPDRWREAFGRPAAFTDLAYAAYASFYLLPLGVALALRRGRGPAAYERAAFTLLLGFYLSYLGYFLMPAEGPRVPRALEAARLGGGAFSEAVRAFLRMSERTTLDAFPSGHTALSVLPALLATRAFPRSAPLLWAWALAIVFATVYLSLHYVVDVLAGLLLVPLTLAVAGPLSRVLGGRRSRAETPGGA